MKSIRLLCCLAIVISFSSITMSASDGTDHMNNGWSLDRTSVPAKPGERTVLTITDPGRYAIWLTSNYGAAITLVDPISGPIKFSGKTGKENGRIDAFLDQGSYRLIINGDSREKDPVVINVEPFKAKGTDNDLVITAEIQTDTLNDFEIRSFWFSREGSGPVRIQAAGRAIGDMRIWHNGSWLMDPIPLSSEIPGKPGQPLTVFTIITHLDPGSYCLKLYGAESLDWAVGGAANPVFIRSGIRQFPIAGSFTSSVSIFGEELYHMPEKTDYFLLESSSVGAGIALQQYDMNNTTHGFDGYFRRITDINFPYQHIQNSWMQSEKLLRVSGTAGAPFRIRWFQNQPTRRKLEEPGLNTLRMYHGANAKDAPPLHAMLFEENNRPDHWKILDSKTGSVSLESPYMARFNLQKTITLFLKFEQDGPYRIASRGTPARYILEPYLLNLPEGYTKPLPQTFPKTEHLGANVYKLTIQPDKIGSIDLMITSGDADSDWSVFTPDNADKLQAPVLENVQLRANRDYWLITNETGFVRGVAIENARTDKSERIILTPDFSGGYPQMSLADTAQVLQLNQPQTVKMDGHSRHMLKINIEEPGVYEVVTSSLLRTNCHFRSELRVELQGYTINANGDNKRMRQFLAPGQYYLTVSTATGGLRPITVSLTRLKERSWGSLTVGRTAAVDMSVAPIPRLSLTATEATEYVVHCNGLTSIPERRLIDDENWPVMIFRNSDEHVELAPGEYQLLLMGDPQTKYARVSFDMKKSADTKYGPGPHIFDPATGGKGFWDTTNYEMTGQEWIFTLQARTRLKLSLTTGMVGELSSPQNPGEIIEIPNGVAISRDLPAGDWSLRVRPGIPDNRKPYEITATTNPLVSAFQAMVKLPGSVPIVYDDDWKESLMVIQTDSAFDVRVTLYLTCEDGNNVTYANDDVVGDWNPTFIVFPENLRSKSNNATLNLLPVSQESGLSRVTMIIPETETVSIPLDGQKTISSDGKTVILTPDKSPESGCWVVSATSSGRFAMSGSSHADIQHEIVIPAGESMEVKLFELENRNTPITVTTKHIEPKTKAEKPGKMILDWTVIALGESRLAVAAQEFNSPGMFMINQNGTTTQRYLDDSFKTTAGDYVYYASQRLLPDESPAVVTLERIVLGKTTNQVIVPVDSIIDCRVNTGNHGIIKLALENGIAPFETVIRQTQSGSHRLEPAKLFNNAEKNSSIMVSIHQYSADSPVMMVNSTGTRWLESGAAIVLNSGMTPISISMEQSVSAFAGDDDVGLDSSAGFIAPVVGSVTLVNTGTDRAGIAWTDDATKIKNLKPKVGMHGENPEIFLGTGTMQSYEFSLNSVRTIGATVTCNSGYVQARIVRIQPNGRGSENMLAGSGLVMNTELDPGQYRLDVWVPPNAPPSSVQVYLILKTPQSLTLFGREE